MRIFALILLLVPFYLNDFANIYIQDWRLWLFIDYVGVKLFPFLVILWLIKSKQMRPAELGLASQSMPSCFAVFLVAALVSTVIDQNGYQLIAELPGYAPLGKIPVITDPVWNRIDLTFGLLLVGIVEELIFRGFLHAFISRYTENSFAIVAISSVAFGLIHWSFGLHTVLIASVIGAVYMLAYLMTRSLPAIMLAHFVLDFIAFAGVIPQSIFKFV